MSPDSAYSPGMARSPWLLVFGTAIGALLVGFFLGQGFGDRPSGPSASMRPDGSRAASPVRTTIEHGDPAGAGWEIGSTTSPGVPGVSIDEAIERIIKAPNSARSYRDLVLATARLELSDIPAALARARSQANANRNSNVLAAIISRWAELDPKAATQYTLTLPERGMGNYLIVSTAGEWAKTQPEAAMAWALAQHMGPQRRSLIEGVASGLAETDPEAALRFFGRTTNEWQGGAALVSIFSTWAERDGAAAAQRALALPITPFRSNALNVAIAGWASREPANAFAFANQMPESADKTNAIMSALQAWASVDPDAAGAQALAMPEGQIRDRVLSQVLQQFTERDLASAMRFIDQMPAGESRDAALSTVVQQLSGTDPSSAAAYLTSFQGAARTQVATGIARTWARMDTAAALAWAQSLADGEEKGAALGEVFGEMSRANPQQAAAQALGKLTGQAQLDVNRNDRAPLGAHRSAGRDDLGGESACRPGS